MDLYAYSQIDVLTPLLKATGVKVERLRGLELMSQVPETKKYSEEEIRRTITRKMTEAVEQYVVQNCWGCWSSSKSDHKHQRKSLIFKDVVHNAGTEDEWTEEDVCVGYKWNLIHGKKRKAIKLRFKQIKKEVRAQMEMYNKYVGTDTLRVHARAGGGNRDWLHMTELAKQPRWLADVDSCWDSTYCDIYIDLTGLDIPALLAEGVEYAKAEEAKMKAEEAEQDGKE